MCSGNFVTNKINIKQLYEYKEHILPDTSFLSDDVTPGPVGPATVLPPDAPLTEGPVGRETCGLEEDEAPEINYQLFAS